MEEKRIEEKWRRGEKEIVRGFAWHVKPSLCPLNK